MDKPRQAFILAAGYGTRLRPYTDIKPKPMVAVDGRALIDRTLDKLRAAGIDDVVVNTHYLHDVIAGHLEGYAKKYPELKITISYEAEILDTGGGLVNVLDHFDPDKPFYVIAGDSLWEDGLCAALQYLALQWNEKDMDILTLMHPVSRMILTKGVGDYNIDGDGRAVRSTDKTGTHMWTNIRLNHPRIYKGYKAEKFSFLDILDQCQKARRLYALEHDGDWHHVSTPSDLKAVNHHYKIAGDTSTKDGGGVA